MSTEIITDADQRMARAVEAMERDFQARAHGSRLDRPGRAHPRRLLRHPDAAQPARRDQRAGAAPDRHPAVGPGGPRCDREGDHQERHRADAQRRRHGRAPQHPAADRGASQGARQSRPQAYGGGARGDPEHPSRRQRPPEARGARRWHRHRRIASPGRHPAEDDRSAHRARSTVAARPRNRRSSRSKWPAHPWPDRPTHHRSRTNARPSDDPFLPAEDLPRHVAIIMDGNRRWARQQHKPELEGHAAGVEAIREILRHAVRRGVPVMTLYAFSRENWARSDDEVAGLFELLEAAVRSETDELRRQGVRVRLLGRLDELPDETRRSIGEALDATVGGERLTAQHRVQLRRADGARRRGPPARGRGHPAGGDRRGDGQRGPVHGRPARSRTC